MQCFRNTVLVISLAAALAACQSTAPAPEKKLYDRLGGKPAIEAVVNDFVGNIAGDARINGFFANTNVPRLKTLLVEQVCAATGGPCTYTGRDMKSAHLGMGVTQAHFNALVEDLAKSLDKFNVPAREKNELLGALATLKNDIVAPPRDGELALPANYSTWPVFLSGVQRPDLKQIRDIWINPVGHATPAGKPFPNGTLMVMELHKVQQNADGTPALDGDGKMRKAGLAKVFVMGKDAGWGQDVPPEQRTGNWIYAAYDAAGAKTADNPATCRACHVPLADKDYVARVDEYFAKRAPASVGHPYFK